MKTQKLYIRSDGYFFKASGSNNVPLNFGAYFSSAKFTVDFEVARSNGTRFYLNFVSIFLSALCWETASAVGCFSTSGLYYKIYDVVFTPSYRAK